MFTVLIRCDPWGCHSRVAIFPQLKLAPETPVWWWLQAGENCHGNFATARSNSEWLRLLVSFCRQDGGHTPVTIPVGPTPILPVKKDQVFHPDFCLSSTKRTPNNGSFRIQKKSNPVFGFYVSLSSDPESHPKVGFESVSGFWFRVSGFVDWNQLSLSVSGFGFRVSGFVDWNQLSLSVSGFGFRVSSIETNFRCRFRVSGLGFRVSSIETNFRCRFRVSGFGFQVSSIETNFRCRFRVSGFGFRRLKPTFAVGFGFRVSGFAVRNQL